MKTLPYLLTYSRLVMAVVYIFISLYQPLQQAHLVVGILVAACVTDIFDGVIARRLKMVTTHLRQLDSKVDTVFWLSLLYLLIIMKSAFVREHAVALFILAASEVFIQLLGYFKFNTSLALHTHAAKVWAVLLTVTVAQIFLGTHANFWFRITFLWGLLVQLEITWIVLKLKVLRSDIASVFDWNAPTRKSDLTND